MKIGCAQDIVAEGTLSQQARFLSDIGFDGMEVEGTPEQISEQLSELRRILAEQIIEISAICGLHRGWLIDPDPEQQRMAQEDITSLLNMAGELGCGVFIIPILGYSNAYPGSRVTGRTAEEDRAILIEALSKLAQRAQKKGTTLLLEVINRYESPICNRLEESAQLIRDINNPACKIHPDFYHMNIEEPDLTAALRIAGDTIGYVHVGDSHRSYPGFGHLDYAELIRTLAEIGYAGYLAVDSGAHDVDPSTVLPHVACFLRGMIGIAAQQHREIE